MAIQTTLETSFPDFFVIFSEKIFFKIEMNIFSGLAGSIELFKGYKTVYFPKAKKIGHFHNGNANYLGNIISWFFVIFSKNIFFKIEMNIFSGLAGSIELFEGYKTVYFRKAKKIGHFANGHPN